MFLLVVLLLLVFASVLKFTSDMLLDHDPHLFFYEREREDTFTVLIL